MVADGCVFVVQDGWIDARTEDLSRRKSWRGIIRNKVMITDVGKENKKKNPQ